MSASKLHQLWQCFGSSGKRLVHQWEAWAREHTERAAAPSRWVGLEPLEPRIFYNTVIWDGGGGDNLWSTAANWDGDVLPGDGDDVVINLSGSSPTIQFTAGTTATVKSLTSHEAFSMEGGTLNLMGNVPDLLEQASTAAWFTAGLTVSGGTINADVGSLPVDIRVTTSDLVLIGGTVSGTVAVEGDSTTAATIDTSSGYSDPITLVARGVGAHLKGNIAAGQKLTIQGTKETAFGTAVLHWDQGLENHGTIVMNTIEFIGASLDIGDGTLINGPDGVIHIERICAGPREITGTGTFTNQGRVIVNNDTELTITGTGGDRLTYELAGGTITGPGVLAHVDVDETVAPSSATTLNLVGFNTRLLSDNEANVTLNILGTDTGGTDDSFSHGVLTLAKPTTTNFGTIVLDSSDLDPSSTTGIGSSNLAIGSNTLVNDGGGTIEVKSGQGGFRQVSGTGTLTNQGTIEVEADTYLIVTGEIADRLEYQAAGGSITGPGYLAHSDVNETVAPLDAHTLRLVGFNNRLVSDNLANTTLIIQGSDTGDVADGFAHAVLSLMQATTSNSGTIVLTSGDIDDSTAAANIATANLDLQGGTLINVSTGMIQVDAGTGVSSFAPNRFIKNGTLDNEGALQVGVDLDFLFEGGFSAAAANHTNAGTLQLANNAVVTVRGNSFTNEATGLIGGSGRVTFSGPSFTNQGTLSPGASAGTLALAGGTMTQTADGVIKIELGGTAAGTGYDQLSLLFDSLTLNGTLDIDRIDGFVEADGDRFQVLITNDIDDASRTLNLTFQDLNDLNTLLMGEGYTLVEGTPWVNFNEVDLRSYGGEDADPTSAIEDDGLQLRLTGNAWKRITLGPYNATADTVLEFDFSSGTQGHIHGIGFDNDDDLTNGNTQLFKLYGSQSSSFETLNTYTDFENYSSSAPGVKHYQIPIGTFFTGQLRYLTFVNDHDVASPNAQSVFANIVITENPAVGESLALSRFAALSGRLRSPSVDAPGLDEWALFSSARDRIRLALRDPFGFSGPPDSGLAGHLANIFSENDEDKSGDTAPSDQPLGDGSVPSLAG